MFEIIETEPKETAMNGLATANQTMTSREIAELTGKEHAHVMRDIRVMLLELHGEIGLSSFGSSYFNSQNKEQPEFKLPKREALILTSGYSVKQRAAIIDRWQELEDRQTFQIPQNLPDALRLAADLADQKAKVEAQLALAAPKTEALDRISLADGEVCLQTAGKLLQQQPNKFIVWLRGVGGWIFKRPGSSRNSAYSDKINAGYLAVRTTITPMPDGSERVNEQVVVTPKGLVKLAQMLGVQMGGAPFGGAS